jgi:hypothetical protein
MVSRGRPWVGPSWLQRVEDDAGGFYISLFFSVFFFVGLVFELRTSLAKKALYHLTHSYSPQEIFMGQFWKCSVSFQPIFYWPEPKHVTKSYCLEMGNVVQKGSRRKENGL